MKTTHTDDSAANRDPITGAPGAHPIGTGLGAAAKRKPTHPGELLREDVLPALKMTQGDLAKRLGVSRLSVSELLHGKRALSPDMAVRIGRLTNTTPQSWLHMQSVVDSWQLYSS